MEFAENQLELHLKSINERQERFLQISEVVLNLLKTKENQDLKLCVMTVLKRTISTIEGIKALIKIKNFTSAAPLARIYLDSLIRLHAFKLYDNPNEIALEVLSGKKIRNLKGRNNKKMTDHYLVNSLSKDYSWITNVYDKTSGYVHFSFQHHNNMIVKQEETGNEIRTFYYMSKNDPHVKTGSWLELTTLILEISKALSKLIYSLLEKDLKSLEE
ncbi:hypothetical protein [uncultured Kordia sp.]|uniref:hypothetical protein n=1 Tax=uncultured Kordia sp. TaxID=507699 RepID=UPI00260DC724|nr:hypothetical protein [uncultured Kordia sp.]